MTAPGATAPLPGRTTHVGHPVGALSALILVGLLALLPCAGRAQAVTGEAVASTGATAAGPVGRAPDEAAQAGAVRPVHHHASADSRADSGLPLTWCTADGEPRRPGDGCSNHPFCASESQLPNAPPQPAATVSAQLVPEGSVPRPATFTTLVGPDHAPDLHALQVHRT